MGRRILKALSIALFPLVIFFAAGTLLNLLSHRSDARKALQAGGRDGCITSTAALNLRPLGYSGSEFRRYWRILGNPSYGDPQIPSAGCVPPGAASHRTPAWIAEVRFIRLDLGFPLVYGGALLAALLMAWNALRRPFRRAWVMAPVLALMGADWAENLAQLRVISHWSAHGESALPSGWIAVASAATVVKCLLIGVCVAGLLALLVWYAARAPALRPADGTVAASGPDGAARAGSG